ncbi:inositol monophosphatase family protein [Micromonospora sp. WMMD1082]|uniref:inositol monophosphatase family protein n=1 Tax=Micromonospora sp. WMMD1082 TaxID=3016104 RepID=UPI002416C227|nr:inositol monophosphatase family protein [Micromonospora sp. WMMD1082]MDG4795541.1 inositol monophosphatase family protein [Micromonospora sp. WMMD1082]
MTDDLLSVALEAAEAGAEAAVGWQRRIGELRIEEKGGPYDLVSQADQAAEAAIRKVLAQVRPDDQVLGEEGGLNDAVGDVRWVVDPIDGTTNFLYGRPDWAVSVAACRADSGELLAGAVVEPVSGRRTWAGAGIGAWSNGARLRPYALNDLQRALVEVHLGRGAWRARAGEVIDALLPNVRDVRRTGSVACALACCATGRAEAAWLPSVQPWDVAAGVLIVRESGWLVGDLTGFTPDGLPCTGEILAAPAPLWEPLRDLLVAAYE